MPYPDPLFGQGPPFFSTHMTMDEYIKITDHHLPDKSHDYPIAMNKEVADRVNELEYKKAISVTAKLETMPLYMRDPETIYNMTIESTKDFINNLFDVCVKEEIMRFENENLSSDYIPMTVEAAFERHIQAYERNKESEMKIEFDRLIEIAKYQLENYKLTWTNAMKESIQLQGPPVLMYNPA